MDVFFVYLLIVSATPLFLWDQRKNLALLHIPFILLLWVYFGMYATMDLTMAMHVLGVSLFVINLVFAHVAAYLIYAKPVIKRKADPKSNLNIIK
ncbi:MULTISPECIES: spore morphogenesis/germination protein YwcE [Bacillaceae]|uniref:spore morphogenesis/germination protein YwcE n=1 Tax=Bacillaceae TaxID=186817 RepID=UPI000C77614C|nr:MULTISPECIES: spore morphogenesis/germination protein YwcE [Bacillaceae]PLR67779.1 spore gernimation protein [Bacillus sp. UMB0893]